MHDLEANKKVAKAYLERIAEGDPDATVALFAEDGVMILPSKTPLPSESRGHAAIREMMVGLPDLFPETGLRIYPEILTAEEDRVAMTGYSMATHASGREYRNQYHFLVTVRDGKIAEVREYMDTAHMISVFFPDA